MRECLLLLVAGCFAPSAHLGLPCGTDGSCPEGQVCAADRTCELEAFAPDAAPVPDSDAEIPTEVPFGASFAIDVGTGGTFDDDPTLSSDELEIVFTSDRSGGQGDCDLWTAKRASMTAPFGAPENLGAAINSSNCDAGGDLSADGRTLYFASRRSGSWDIYVSHRADPSAPWGAASPVPGLSSASVDEQGPSLSADGSTLVFYSKGGTSNNDLWMTTLRPDGTWAPPTKIEELATGSNEDSPHLAYDGLALWFVSNRDQTDSSDYDIWVARRFTTTAAWNQPARIDELAAGGEEDDPWLSHDGQRIYYAHGSSGNRLRGAVRQ